MAAAATPRGALHHAPGQTTAEPRSIEAAVMEAAVHSVQAAESALAERNVGTAATKHEQWLRHQQEKQERIAARLITHKVRFHLHLHRLRWAMTDFSILLGAVLTTSDALGSDHSSGRLVAGFTSFACGSASAAWHLRKPVVDDRLADPEAASQITPRPP
jgi:hypothetical protein